MLLLWPEIYPDTCSSTTTPGLVDNDFIQKINQNKRKLYLTEKRKDRESLATQKLLENLRNQQYFLENSVPFAFLEIEFPEVNYQENLNQWGREIIYEDRMDSIGECGYVCQEMSNVEGDVFNSSHFSQYFMGADFYTTFLRVRDFDYDLDRQDHALESYYQVKIDNGDASNLVPTTEE